MFDDFVAVTVLFAALVTSKKSQTLSERLVREANQSRNRATPTASLALARCGYQSELQGSGGRGAPRGPSTALSSPSRTTTSLGITSPLRERWTKHHHPPTQPAAPLRLCYTFSFTITGAEPPIRNASFQRICGLFSPRSHQETDCRQVH